MTEEAALRQSIEAIGEEANATAIGVATYDFEHDRGWSLNGDRWFHAASTIKVPVLLGVFDAIAQGRFEPHSRVHVRNRFYSVVDGAPFRVQSGRDANSEVHSSIGRMLMIRELAEHMIVTSSNLATNLLLDIVGVDHIRSTIDRLSLDGIDLRRGVEDETAWEKGINNQITATGLCHALRLIEERRAISERASADMLDILHKQRFRSGIPAGLPDGARVANKTGDMSTVSHDGGIVYLEGRKPYVLVVLTEWESDAGSRSRTIAKISRAVFEHLGQEA